MVTQQIDGHLIEWDQIDNLGWSEILLGNGFSMNIWDGFGYSSLFTVAIDEDFGHPLSMESKQIFERLNTINFENGLQVLKSALLAA